MLLWLVGSIPQFSLARVTSNSSQFPFPETPDSPGTIHCFLVLLCWIIFNFVQYVQDYHYFTIAAIKVTVFAVLSYSSFLAQLAELFI